MTKFKILAAALGLVLATGAIGDVSAKTSTITPVTTHSVSGKAFATKTFAKKTVATKTVALKHHRVHLARHGVKTVKIAHKMTTRAKIAHKLGLKHIAKANLAKGKTTVIR